MSLTDELRKLADLRNEGQLTDQEFAEAKRGLLAQSGGPVPAEPGAKPGPAKAAPKAPAVFWSSRWSSGNLFFPDAVVLADDGVLFRKRSLFGSREEHINYRAIASIRVKNGVFLSSISIETSGGSQPIFVNGLWNSDARKIQDLVRLHQGGP